MLKFNHPVSYQCTVDCLVSNWILMSCQPHRVTSEQSNSGHKQKQISKLLSHIHQPLSSHFSHIHQPVSSHFSHIHQPLSSRSTKTNHESKHKTYTYTQTSDTHFRRVSPFSITPVKKHINAITCWYQTIPSNLSIPG